MARIDETRNRPGSQTGKSGRASGSDAASAAGGSAADRARRFELSLDSLQPARRSGRSLNDVLDDVHRRGSELVRSPGYDNVRRYREAVSEFLQLAVDAVYQTEEQLSSPNILNQKRYRLVRIINEKLDRFVAEVLADQRPQSELLAAVNEIHGLLVNLLH